MGCFGPNVSKSSYDPQPARQEVKVVVEHVHRTVSPNPDPRQFEILRSQKVGSGLVVKARYPGCTAYEGVKILLFKGATIGMLRKQKVLDPHFSRSTDYLSPIARFEPTKAGWAMALLCARMIP